MRIIRWIFFDIGSTLTDEEEAYRHRARDMTRGTTVSFDEFWARRTELVKAGRDGDREAAAFFGLAKTPWHSEDETPYEDCAQTLLALCEKGFRLGIIANQIPGTKERLERWGLGRFFSVIAASADLGIAKPDRRIFQMALDLAGCLPENAVMVGDRVDNDIRPARELGMVTIRIRRGPAAFAEPSCGAERADYEICQLNEIPAIVENLKQGSTL